MSTAGFLKQNAPWLTAGGLLTFGSSYGQTYFISVFAGEIRGEFGLSHGDWGSLYALGTVASAALMLSIGGVVDRYRARSIAIINICVFSIVCLAMAAAPAAWMLPVIIFGLRFCGQGMMSHLAIVSMGRWFAAARGKAISIATLGFSLGEAALPFLFVTLMGVVGWRASWGVAALSLLLLIPLLMLMLRQERSPRGVAEIAQGAGMLGRHWTRGQALRNWLFWACLPGLLTQPIIGTAFFFQQVHMVEIKGWRLEEFASLFPLYTAASLVGLALGGVLVDRLGAGRLMPVYMLPQAVGLILIAGSDSLVAGAGCMVLFGIMQGSSAATLGSFWPEFYGTRHLGAIRSVSTALMVFATAIGPLATGYMIDAGIDYNDQLRGMAAAICIVSGIYFFAMRQARSLLRDPQASSA